MEGVMKPEAFRQRIVNVLAFSAPFMQRLWERTATTCSMPLQVPPEATQSLDIPSLAGGVASFNTWQV
jgi:hypothetical protein